MTRKISLTLFVAIVSLLIIGFAGTATAEADGNCIETLLVNVSAGESTTLTNCRAFQADAARYTGLAAFYTNEKTNVQPAFQADPARYTGLAAFYTAEAAAKCLGIASTDMTAVELVNCLSDSAYQAANPELMIAHRFVVANGSATAELVSDSAYLAANPELMAGHHSVVADDSAVSQPQVQRDRFLDNIDEIRATQTDPVVEPVDLQVPRNRFLDNMEEIRATQADSAAEPVDIEVLRNNYYNYLWATKHGYYYSSVTTQTDLAVEPVDIQFLQNLSLDRNYFHPGR